MRTRGARRRDWGAPGLEAPEARRMESGQFRIGELPRSADEASAPPPSGRTLDELDFPTVEEKPIALDLRPAPAAKRRVGAQPRVAPGAQRPVIRQRAASPSSMASVGVLLLVLSLAGVAGVLLDAMK